MMAKEDNWYRFEGVEQVDSPALLIYSEKVVQNIELVKTMVPSVDMLRPHVKTNKSADAATLMIQYGISKFKCATIAEAEMLGMIQAKDVLLAYQPTAAKLQRLLKTISAYPETKFSCLVDNIDTAVMISNAAQQMEISVAVFIDLNVGMNRTGISPALAFDLFIEVMLLPGITFSGFHAYDGHIGDKDLVERAEHCDIDFASTEVLRKKIQGYGYPNPLLVAGGTPTFNLHSKREHVECSPGTFIYWDKGYYDAMPEQDFSFAAVVLTRVVSLPDESKICIDLGHKAIASENSLQNRVYFLKAPALKPYSHSEEHMVIEAGEGHGYKIGDLLYGVPYHVCPTVALYNKAYIISDNKLNGAWPITSRGREINF